MARYRHRANFDETRFPCLEEFLFIFVLTSSIYLLLATLLCFYSLSGESLRGVCHTILNSSSDNYQHKEISRLFSSDRHFYSLSMYALSRCDKPLIPRNLCCWQCLRMPNDMLSIWLQSNTRITNSKIKLGKGTIKYWKRREVWVTRHLKVTC